MKKKTFLITALAIFLLAAATVVTFSLPRDVSPGQDSSAHYSAEQILLSAVPASIKAEMEASLNKGGAYFYREETGSTVYALLTFGTVIGMDMNVIPRPVEDGIYFSVSAAETGGAEEGVVYQVYKTDAPAVAADTQRLSNPYLKPGAAGVNVGVVTKTESFYYIMPLLDTGTGSRVYSSAETLNNGIYRFTYEITPDGAQLLTAEPLERYQCVGTVTEFTGGPTPSVKVLIGDERLAFDMRVDSSLVDLFAEMDEYDESLLCNLDFNYNNGLVLSTCSVSSRVQNGA